MPAKSTESGKLTITHPDKILWRYPEIDKRQFILYLSQVSQVMLPFLKNRILTSVRFPHGVFGEAFYQKHCPEYAPDFVHAVMVENEKYIVCNDILTFLWLGNQLVMEFHIPFQRIHDESPCEIVFDLDPENRDDFPLAVKAALEIKSILDRLDIAGYPKLSGSRGIQIHIPIFGSHLTYDDTRLFTSFVAKTLVERHPGEFTTERLKKNRQNRLYVDYVQHAPGKTVICPYSPRGKEGATVAAPLYWKEVNEELNMDRYTIPFVLRRVSEGVNPMQGYFEQKNPSVPIVISTLKHRENKLDDHS